MEDARPEVGYQVGVTPPSTEDPRCKTDAACQEIIEKLPIESRPLTSSGPDPKWRYAWRIGNSNKNEELKLLKSEQVVPKGFPTWEKVMDEWGNLMHQAVASISQLAALGFELPMNTFYDLIRDGAHLLSPTGSNLNEHNKKDTILAGFHYDLCFLTIHGKSRFPGLNIWARNNFEKVPVKVPDGYLLVQAGKQFEWVTGGVIKAGYHEVIVNDGTIQAIQKAKDEKRSLWRVSSTLFNHIQSDKFMEPISQLKEYDSFNSEKYPKMLAHDYVVKELAGINLFS
ncbi:Clavaminate synthase-like protein [Neoconidiobolus thromboides FSU 785]|nr:Clavaminate synthase-like protein [Neoconidiobolus thromboides FSU 785]